MMNRILIASMIVPLLAQSGCSSGDDGDGSGAGDSDVAAGGGSVPGGEAVDASLFANAAYPLTVTSGVSCELSGGTATTCVTIATKDLPDHEMGPFCQGGYWLGEQIFSEPNECTLEGQVEGCLECTPVSQSLTFTIPAKPVPASASIPFAQAMGRATGVGIALNGVALFLPDPEEKLIATNNQAPVDACGGHAGFADDYHYHRIPSCLIEDKDGEHSPMFGYALDGYPIYGQYGEGGEAPTDLDDCQGHSHGDYGYHYHAKAEFPYFLSCFKGELGESTGAMGGMGGPPGGGAPGGGMAP